MALDNQTGHLLVVDDDPLILDLCERTLRYAGFYVDQASSGELVLEMIQNRRFDLLLLDMHMPGMDGLTLLERIRSENLDIPIVIITGAATVEHAARAIRSGAQGFLLKPFSTADLVQTVRDVLKKRRDVRTYDRVVALRPLARVSQRLLAELDLPRLYDLIIATVRTELDADRASLMLIDQNNLRIAACAGLPEKIQVGQLVSLESSLAGWVARSRNPLLVDERFDDMPPLTDLRDLLVEDQLVSALSVPVIAGKQVLGVLNAGKTRNSRPFSDADRELLVLLAGQAAIALENARLYTSVAQSEARYRALLHHASDSVLLLDAHAQTIIDANSAFSHLSGYSHDDLLHISPTTLLPQIDLVIGLQSSPSPDKGPTHPALNNSQNGFSEIETTIKTRAGAPLPVAVSVSRIPHAGQDLLLLIAREISERQRIAQQLLQTEKLAAVGRLSASIAHEMNNPLQALNNSLNLLLSRDDLSESKRSLYLSMARDEVTRLISIVQRMIDFYRPSREGMRPTDLNDLLDTVLSMASEQLDFHNVRIITDLTPRLPLVFAIGNHIKQVYLNIILNAVEAMPGGGALSIRTYVAPADEPPPQGSYSLAPSSGASGYRMREPSVVVEFSDTGRGIPPEDLPKIFEPFYTTRDRGTGLGLAVSYSIIEQHNGELSVSSTVGAGSTFRLRMPIAT